MYFFDISSEQTEFFRQFFIAAINDSRLIDAAFAIGAERSEYLTESAAAFKVIVEEAGLLEEIGG